MKVYLDNAATTPLDERVLEAMLPYMTDHFGNPSSTHQFGRKTKSAIETSRRAIAGALNVTPAEICFTSGGTEADNLAIRGSVNDLGCTRIITSALEHSAVIKTSAEMEKAGLAEVCMVNLKSDGHIDLEHLESLLNTDKKCLVSLMHGNNEIANLLPLKRVGELCKKYNAIFHSDTVQTMGHYAFDLQDIHVHFITGAAHKFHGPKGIGFLYINRQIHVSPIITGGGQEREQRGGTENLYGIVGLGKAIQLAYEHLEEHQEHIGGMKQYMIAQINEHIPGCEFNGDCRSEDSLYTVLNVTLPENPNSSMMLFLLDIDGVACSGGSACSSGASKGSHVLTALDAIKPNRTSLRFSFGRFTTREHIDFAVSKLKDLCAVKENAPGTKVRAR
ncbi:MAG: cysteine desulfurase [Flavobacteriales bacterium]|nr:cysteine desulfurase [Flavobacteriales bacterium]